MRRAASWRGALSPSDRRACKTVPMDSRRRFLNPAQPQTLQIAVFLLYANAIIPLAFFLLRLTGLALIDLIIIPAGFAGAYGIANERKWGYGLGLAVAILPFIPLALDVFGGRPLAFGPAGLLSLMFMIALVALLVHPQSRDYQRIWFK